jgi:hypothetical protein
MHSKLLHEALQKEETRAIVIEVEEGPVEPGEDEEFYAANFELLGQEDEDEEEGMESYDEVPPLVDSDEEPDEEPPPFRDLEEGRPRLCQQRVPMEVNGNLTSLHTLYDWESANTLVRKESARRIGLQGVRAPRQAIKGYQGEGLITDSVYYLPLLDVDGNIQVIRAYGVDEIAVVTRTRLPPVAREIFPVIRAYMPWMETGAIPGMAQQAHKEAVSRQPRGPRKSGWRSTEAGARARGVAGIAACKMLRVQETGVKGHVPEAAEGPLLKGLPPSGERQVKEAGRGDQVGHTGAHRCLQPRSGCRILRSNGECCPDPRGRYRHPRKEHPPTPCLRLAGVVGVEVGRVEAGGAEGERSGPSSHADSPSPAQEEYQDRCSRRDQ